MLALRAVFFSISILSIFAIPTPRSSFVTREKIDGPPNGFTPNGAAPGETIINLRIALKSNNWQGLQDALFNASTPGSPSYGNYLSKKQIDTFVAPSPETQSAVGKWLSDNGIQPQVTSTAGNWLSMNVSVSQANQLLDATYSSYKNEATGENTIRTLAYSLPSDIQPHVNLILPTTNFPIPAQRSAVKADEDALFVAPKVNKVTKTRRNPTCKAKQPAASVPAPDSPSGNSIAFQANTTACSSTVTPACIQGLYGLPSTIEPQNASQIGVSGFVNEFAQQQDLDFFVEVFRPDLKNSGISVTFSVQSVNGGINTQSEQDAGLEADADIQYTAGLAIGVPTKFFSVGTGNLTISSIDDFIDLANFLNNEDDIPPVLTTSFTFLESHNTASAMQQLCNEYMQLGARGVSILYASGDGGVISNILPTCTADGTCPVTEITSFLPTFPSSCPYVTSVGATQSFGPEEAASLTSGGFSNVFATPEYQQAAVNGFLQQLGDAHAGKFNASGRGFPDIAAQGINIAAFVGTAAEFLVGTSLSSPIVASIFAVANALRIEQGKTALGFLNPIIYATEGLFTDVTTGSNNVCNCEGFSATTGWDPASGLGTPILDRLVALP